MRGTQAVFLLAAVLCGRLGESLASARGPTYADLPDSMVKGNVVTGHLKVFVDNYIEQYNEEESHFEDKIKTMDHVIQHAMDEEAKESAVDQKLTMKASHEKKLQGIAGMIRTLDGACGSLHKARGSNWLDKFPDEKARVAEIYEANPASLLAKSQRVLKAQTGVSAMAQAEDVLSRAAAYLKYLEGPEPLPIPGAPKPTKGSEPTAVAPVKR